ncbi:recombination regulator RecX [Collinsella sp. zg1085]|uniref:regulatory protein RecX n=1 Tax=Collinsella sp. zg1085 TaxID=2844380 RepID=UPI001C0BA15F|nr:regulatory protein RecX [Collinsella sp. zg1085]QWT16995.1 recombination regulator RecX [Collinsella sp. zg1085]
MLQLVRFQVFFPTKDERAHYSGFSHSKPRARLIFELDDSSERELKIPVRVGRQLVEEGLELPQELEAGFQELYALETKVALQMIGEMLSRRDYATQEIRQKLCGYGFRDTEIERSIERAVELGFLNDIRFASFFIESRKRQGLGQLKIELELRRRGISIEDIPGYPEVFFSQEDDYERAYSLLRKKSIPSLRAYEKLLRFLISKGFSYALAKDIVGRYLNEQDTEHEDLI